MRHTTAAGWCMHAEHTASVLGQGGFGKVTLLRRTNDGHELACKSISKVLDVVGLPMAKVALHLERIKNEVRQESAEQAMPVTNHASTAVLHPTSFRVVVYTAV